MKKSDKVEHLLSFIKNSRSEIPEKLIAEQFLNDLFPEYTFTFNKGLSTFLVKLYERNRPCKTDDLGLTYAQRTNSQKLAYWGLAEPYTDPECEESITKRGWWMITDKGKRFVEGLISIPKKVKTRCGDVTGYLGEDITLTDVREGYQYRQDYQNQRS
jgi:hypothetical protein